MARGARTVARSRSRAASATRILKVLLPVYALVLSPALVNAQTTTTWGWDYNLTKRCVKSPHPELANYYVDETQCGTDDKRWTIAVESEKAFGISCPGPVNQSFAINGEGSPVSMDWAPHVDELGRSNWAVTLETDFQSTTHPCGSGYWTWYMFMDHVAHGGGPFPPPLSAKFSGTVNYSDVVTAGQTRALAKFRAYWDGKPRTIELMFAGENWPDNVPGDPLVYTYRSTDKSDYVGVDGKALRITAAEGVDTVLTIPWYKIVRTLVKKGYLKAPTGGWSTAETRAMGLGHEVKNNTATSSVSASLWFTNFRPEAYTR